MRNNKFNPLLAVSSCQKEVAWLLMGAIQFSGKKYPVCGLEIIFIANFTSRCINKIDDILSH